MMREKNFYFSFAVATCLSGHGFLPHNNLKISAFDKEISLSEDQYEAAITKVENYYRPILPNLVIKRLWDDDTVNAGTYIDDQTGEKIINIYGGIARHPLMTPDGLALVVCHEIGHHLGGVPRKTDSNFQWIWAATEGQADYFATLKCLRKIFANEDNGHAIRGLNTPQIVRDNCKKWFRAEESAVCIRTSMAGLAVANVMASSLEKPLASFATPDPNIVQMTLEFHPEPQCRLDTYFQGSLCTVNARISTSQTSELPGTCNTSQGYVAGVRPLCWFKPINK